MKIKKILGFVLALTLLSGCGGGGMSSPAQTPEAAAPTPAITELERVSLTLATSVYTDETHREVLNRLIEAYTSQVIHVSIDVVELSEGQEADIVHVNPGHLARYGLAPDNFVDFAPLMAHTNFMQNLVGQELLIHDGQVFALSNYGFSTTGIFYRRSMLEDAGIDPRSIRTHGDFREIATSFANGGRYAMSVTPGLDEWISLVAGPISAGGLYFTGEAPFTAENVNVNSEENIWAANLWQEWVVRDGLFNIVPDRNEAREQFLNGNVPFNIDGPQLINKIIERDPALLDDIGIIPNFHLMFQGRLVIPRPSLDVLATMLIQNSAHESEAINFMSWLTGDGAQWLISHSGMVPSSRSFAAMEVYRENNPLEFQFFNFMVNYYGSLVFNPIIPEMDEIELVMAEAAERMFSQEAADVEDEMNAAFTRIQEIME